LHQHITIITVSFNETREASIVGATVRGNFILLYIKSFHCKSRTCILCYALPEPAAASRRLNRKAPPLLAFRVITGRPEVRRRLAHETAVITGLLVHEQSWPRDSPSAAQWLPAVAACPRRARASLALRRVASAADTSDDAPLLASRTYR
jgi:hypothetical protein